ncbi:hypothetical protein CCYA_CCYA20G4807 [Cyanidiococcus yangmingshanensis]|nr:hypothetical protein CCYA_CCYA20G4807 [Cyanidiococcus yangmingshanensis]
MDESEPRSSKKFAEKDLEAVECQLSCTCANSAKSQSVGERVATSTTLRPAPRRAGSGIATSTLSEVEEQQSSEQEKTRTTRVIEDSKFEARPRGRLPASAVRLPGLPEVAQRTGQGPVSAEDRGANEDATVNSDLKVPLNLTVRERDHYVDAGATDISDIEHVEVRAGGKGILRPRSYDHREQQRYGLPGMVPKQPLPGHSVERSELEAALARQRARNTKSAIETSDHCNSDSSPPDALQ